MAIQALLENHIPAGCYHLVGAAENWLPDADSPAGRTGEIGIRVRKTRAVLQAIIAEVFLIIGKENTAQGGSEG
jgi:hypothetical protein